MQQRVCRSQTLRIPIYILFVYMYVGIYNTEIAVLTCNVKRVKKAIVFLRISGKIQKYILYIMVAGCAKPRLAVPSRGANFYEYILILHRKPIRVSPTCINIIQNDFETLAEQRL